MGPPSASTQHQLASRPPAIFLQSKQGLFCSIDCHIELRSYEGEEEKRHEEKKKMYETRKEGSKREERVFNSKYKIRTRCREKGRTRREKELLHADQIASLALSLHAVPCRCRARPCHAMPMLFNLETVRMNPK